jgi:integrase/recombinase XerC
MGFFFTDKFLDYLRFERKYSEHTCIAYENDLKDFNDFVLKNFEIEDVKKIQSDMVRTWVSELIAQKYASVSVRRKISSLRTFYRYLQKQKLVSASPVSNIPNLKISKKLPVIIEREAMDKILDKKQEIGSYEDHLAFMIISILYGTGFRRAELISLQVSDIDFANRFIKILGKRNKERLVPINLELSEQITEFVESRKKLGINSEHLLVTKKSKKLYPGYIYNVVKNFLTLQQVNGKRSPHILRHTYATRLLQNGAELLSVKELLGHSSLASTQVYTHVNIEDLKRIYKKNHPKQ